ncbi:MBL fold metallo-hydrolase [Fodinibacter luteus]|uniref:MBL fold metallo-hydrolase n=1 Tax=Fodinibacter luteus TaxID=552064 RepID=A0ABP8KBI6_9MICO
MARRPDGGSREDAGVHVTWLGHATVLLEVAGVRLLTDPLLRARFGPLRRRGDLPVHRHVDDVDAVLLSHLHHDHADLPSLRRLGHVPVLTDPANVPWVDRQHLGVGDASADEWRPVAPGVEVLLVRADHDARPMPHRPNGTTGMLVRGGGVVVWFAGDTSLHDEMTLLPELAGAPVDLALLPVGGWGPRLSPGHMGPAEAAEAAARSGARHVVPIHYGTLHPTGWPATRLGWTTDPGHRLVEVLPRWSDATLHVPDVGGAVRVTPRGGVPT